MNIDPEEAMKNGSLRQDLFFRLGVIQFFVPPLRERKEDIAPLTVHFIDYFNRKMNKNIYETDEDVKRIFDAYPWPGNVRELRNVMESAFNMADGDIITMDDIPEYLSVYDRKERITIPYTGTSGLADLVSQYEKTIIEETLKNSDSLTAAASVLKMTRQAVKYKIEKYGIDYQKFLKM